MHYLVTGGAGFIGSEFIRNLSSMDSAVVLDNLSFGFLENIENSSKVSLLNRDISLSETFQEIKGEKFDAIVHFAAETHVDRSITHPENFLSTNVTGTFRVLEFALSAGIPRTLHVSTDEVYGSIAEGSWTEESPMLPRSPYSASKAAAEMLAKSYHTTFGLDVVITRCGNNFGTHQMVEKLIPLAVSKLSRNEVVPVYGSGQQVREWIHVSDHCKGIVRAIKAGSPGEVYNIGGGRELTNLELLRMILVLMGKDSRLLTSVADRKGHDFRYSMDWSKSLNKLGYAPEADFNVALEQTVEWYLQNPKWILQSEAKIKANLEGYSS